MATTILEADVIGSSFTKSSFDYGRTKSVRKFVVHNDVTPRTNMGSFDNIIADMKAEDEDGSPANVTPLGPTLGNEAGAAIVHPVDNELPLQTVDVASLGADKFLVTAQYFVIPGVSGGAGNVPNTMSLRAEYAAKEIMQVKDENGEMQILDKNLITTAVQLKIRIPFYTATNPIKADGGVLNYLGGRNNQTSIGGVQFAQNTVRFDGVTMDEFGGLVSDGANTYRFKGFYEFTARSDQFLENIVSRGPNQAPISGYPTIELANDGWTIGDFEF